MKGEVNRTLEILEGAKDESGCVPMTLVRRAFKKLEQRWIPCSERLPEDERRVLILNDDNLYMIGFVKETDWGKEWRYQFDMYDDDVYEEKEQGKIIAWRLLPEPYREEK